MAKAVKLIKRESDNLNIEKLLSALPVTFLSCI